MNESTALVHHLCYDLFPPLGTEFLEAARIALRRAREDEWEEEIDTPQGPMSVEEVIDFCNLHGFLEEEA